IIRLSTRSTLFPYTTLFRSITKFQKVGKNGKKMSARFGTDYQHDIYLDNPWKGKVPAEWLNADPSEVLDELGGLEAVFPDWIIRSEEHTSELQSRENLVCRL